MNKEEWWSKIVAKHAFRSISRIRYTNSIGVNKRLLIWIEFCCFWMKQTDLERKFFSKKVLHIQVMGIFQRPLKRLILICDFLLLKKKDLKFRGKKKTFEVRSEVRRNKKFLFFTEYSFSHCFPQSMLKWNRYAAKVFMVASSSLDVFLKKWKVRQYVVWTL